MDNRPLKTYPGFGIPQVGGAHNEKPSMEATANYQRKRSCRLPFVGCCLGINVLWAQKTNKDDHSRTRYSLHLQGLGQPRSQCLQSMTTATQLQFAGNAVPKAQLSARIIAFRHKQTTNTYNLDATLDPQPTSGPIESHCCPRLLGLR